MKIDGNVEDEGRLTGRFRDVPIRGRPVEHVASGAFEDMQKGRSCDVSAACHWAVNASASVRGGKMWGKAYSICPSGIFVPPESGHQRPEDLARGPGCRSPEGRQIHR